MTSEETRIWFEEFCRREYVAVYRYVYAHTGHVEDTRDAVQESFLHFYQLLLGGDIREHERALLFRIARNKAIDLVRQRARQQAQTTAWQTSNVLPFKPPEQRSPEEWLLEKERIHLAEAALAGLSERDQEYLALRRSGLTNQEVAETLHVSDSTVRQIISRALRRFVQVYDQLLGDKTMASLPNRTSDRTDDITFGKNKRN
ncbi:MAG: RNA polymerase sigma factor [Blastocatellales bacterium]